MANKRLLPVSGAFNLRDLGGYQAHNGTNVKWKVLFRSDDLNNLTDADLSYLNTLSVKSFVDFRDDRERNTAPDRQPKSVVNIYELPIDTASLVNLQDVSIKNSSNLMIQANISFVRDWQQVYRGFFEILMNNDNVPLLFHCSAGKDRTGFAATLLLSSLGVGKEDIIGDYLLSSECLKNKYADFMNAHPALAPMMTVQKDYIQAVFDVIDSEYGGMERYLVDFLDVDIDRMRSLYTE